MDEQAHDNHLLLSDLPSEVLLTIANRLEKESQVLLSLTNRRLRNLLSSRLNLTFNDLTAKVRFLHKLELDHPQYLTCRYCGFLYP